VADDLPQFGLRFHHLGLAVAEPEAAIRFLGAMGYRVQTRVFDPLQNVNLMMLEHATMPDVEAVWPGDEPSPIDGMIRQGHMVYHLCYVTDDPEASIAAMERAGMEVLPVGQAKPARLFGGTPVSFHHVDGFGLIELIHGEPRDRNEPS
jgi:hypothetical protein